MNGREPRSAEVMELLLLVAVVVVVSLVMGLLLSRFVGSAGDAWARWCDTHADDAARAVLCR